MRGVLVDDDEAAFGLRDDVVLVHLPPRRTERLRLLRLGHGRLGLRLDDPPAPRALHLGEAGLGRGARRSLRRIGSRARAHRGPIHLVDPGRPRGLWPHRAEGGARDRRRGPVPRLGKRMPQARHDQAAHRPRLTEPHLGLGGMHVHVDKLRLAIDEQRHGRMPVAAEEVLVCPAQRADQHPVLHRTAVDEEVLRHARAPRIGRQPGEAGQPDPLALGVDGDRVLGELAAHDLCQTSPERIEKIAGHRVGAERRPPLAPARDVAQREPYRGLGHREAPDHLAHGLRLGAVRSQELQPGRGGVEEIAQRDSGPAGPRAGLRLCHRAARDRKSPPLRIRRRGTGAPAVRPRQATAAPRPGSRRNGC